MVAMAWFETPTNYQLKTTIDTFLVVEVRVTAALGYQLWRGIQSGDLPWKPNAILDM